MKKALIMLLLMLAVLAAGAEVIDRIVAKVGTDVILLSDLQKQLSQMQSAKVLKPDTDPREVLVEMIEQRLMIQRAKDLNIKIDEARIKGNAERYLKQIKARYPSEQAFAADLRKSKLTESDLLKYYVDMLSESALTEQLVNKYISSKVKISDKEMMAFYTATKDTLAVKPVSWKLGMIMREVNAGNEADAQKLSEIQAILARLKAGEDFATLAAAESDCPSKEVGGDLGFFTAGMMVKPFEQAAFALKEGDISEIVKTQFGYHIIKMEEKRDKEIRVRHILKMVSATNADSLAERNLMDSIRQRFIAGESFASLAQAYSMDPETKNEGGVIGEFAESELPELFAIPIMQVPVGDISAVMENEGMLYLFIRLEELPPRIFSYEEVKEQIQQFLFQRKQMEEYNKWMSELKRESYVQIVL
ncbi:MAG: peptidylprolyl isomerase [Candidatus Cloacimonetes bacterium HGW-Cloacimonetes-3]|jgi:parvulin-like peptidyl-prolyl isomerase|nr:MAG: peptidylprolyl isomerase [Candidatus Cloacimonetes bacterium HGW-Cloacimonetes-3]